MSLQEGLGEFCRELMLLELRFVGLPALSLDGKTTFCISLSLGLFSTPAQETKELGALHPVGLSLSLRLEFLLFFVADFFSHQSLCIISYCAGRSEFRVPEREDEK